MSKVTDPSGRTVYDMSPRERANGNKQALWRVTDDGRSAVRAAASHLDSASYHLPEVARYIGVFRDVAHR